MCILAAAANNDMELFVRLRRLLFEIGEGVDVLQTATVAVRSDRVAILQQLLTSLDIDLQTLPFDSLMKVAVKYSSINIVEYLLSFEPRLDLKEPYKLALCYSDLNVLR